MDERKNKGHATFKSSNFFAGAAAGAIAACVVSPFEIVRAAMQKRQEKGKTYRSASDIVRYVFSRHGPRGFYSGLPLTLIGALPGRGSYFLGYHTAKSNLSELFDDGPLVHMASGAFGSAFSNTLTNPIWLVKTRYQLQVGAGCGKYYGSYADAARKILREEGIGGFYKGLRASYWGTTEAALQFVLYEQLQKTHRKEDEKPWHGAAFGGLSKLGASITTYPHEVVRLRMREKPEYPGAIPRYTGMIQALQLIAKEEGRAGLYRGISMHLARTVPNSAILFFFFEYFKLKFENAKFK